MTRAIEVPSLLSSSEFYLASGTVTLDLVRHKVLVIRDRISGTYSLPRGRKDWGETLEGTAERETYEETGARAKLLPVPLATRSTPPQSRDPTHGPDQQALETAQIDTDVWRALLTEPAALMQHFQPNGALAVVLWYVAAADSTLALACGTQMADENFESSWVDYDDAAGMMVNPEYAQVVRRALELVDTLERTGPVSIDKLKAATMNGNGSNGTHFVGGGVQTSVLPAFSR
ncbi:NUDIX hydrolase domain-like protein [Diplogelasinospora grovesii]|uniref:NUDIX hydrolase domain-like protein n=1 Tax=Diplogelasinospora grovesii TaxID=303347 RepID=A0AAN6N8S5_9PEZI|nr:NUDIX hydrolase domain-like protein [Diplogelasinospora grovesii]